MSDSDEDWFDKDIDDFVVKPAVADNNVEDITVKPKKAPVSDVAPAAPPPAEADG